MLKMAVPTNTLTGGIGAKLLGTKNSRGKLISPP